MTEIENIHIEKTTYRGDLRLDIRYYANNRPTKRGVSIPWALVPSVLKAIQTLNGDAEEWTVGRNTLIAQHTVFRGQTRLDIRWHYDGDKPTRRGISILLANDLAARVIEAALVLVLSNEVNP